MISTFNILDHDQPDYVQKFDQLVSVLKSTNPIDISNAQEKLSSFVNAETSLYVVDKLLQHSTMRDTKFIALQVLNDAVNKLWYTIDTVNQAAIKKLVTGHIAALCTTWESVRENKVLLTKYNLVLVSIAKREYPQIWPTFIKDICSSADLNNPMILNNMELLKLAGEEVLEFGQSSKTMTRRWRERKKEALSEDFQYIMQMAGTVLVQSADPYVLKTSLELLTTYIPWMDPSYFIHEAILEKIANCIVGDPIVREAGLVCFTEICSSPVKQSGSGDVHGKLTVDAFRYVFNQIVAALPTSHSALADRVVSLYEIGNDVDQTFIVHLSQMIIAFLQNYIKKILYDEILLVAVHEVLVGVSNVLGDKELFKTCVEYWQWIGEFMLRSPPSTMKQTLERRLGPVQSSVRFILVKRMAKPKEVIIVVEDGQVYRERVQDVEEVQMFELMQRTMITYTLLNVTDTRQIIISLLSRQLDGSEFTFDNINSLSWAAGSIGDVLPEEDEHCFFIEFLKGLLKLCKQLSGKQNRAVVASNILYFVGRYTRFLRQRWNFFRIVNKKVFEFMQDTFEGVQEMAVDTLYKLSHDLAPLYVEESGNITIDGDEGVDSSNCRNLAEAIAQVWPQKLKLLSTPLREVCFACAGCMVAVDNNAELKDPNAQRSLLFNFLREEQEVYRMLMLEAANGGANFLRDRTKMMMLVANLKMFSSIASTCGDTFVAQMELIISDLYGFYRLVGSAQGELAQQSNGQIDYDYARGLRLVKREILKLFENFVENSQQKDFIAQFCIPQLFEVVLVDYNSSEASVKEPVALALTAVAIDTLGGRLSDKVAAVLDFTFATTVDIISKDFESHPEFRVNLFKLLKSLTVNCFPAFLNYVYSHAYIVDGLLWSIKHVDNVTMTTALETLLNFLLRINTMEDGSQANSPVMQFYQRFMQPLLREVFLVTLDSLHASGFQYHCAILQVLFAVSSSVNPADTVVGRQAVTNFLLAELKEIPAVTPTLLQDFIYRCFEYCGPDQSESFSSTIADFLVETRVWGAEEERRMLESETLQAPTNSLVM